MTFRSRRTRSLAFFAFLLFSLYLAGQERPIIAQFRPVSPAELALKEDPAAPGVNAMILEWTIDRNDEEGREVEYFRIKIFSEAGRKHADVEIPYSSDRVSVLDIKARTIQPDGTIVPFNGKVFEKIVIKTSSYQIKAKTFTFPAVQPGSILEFHYRRVWDNNYIFTTRWDLQRDLFVRKARLTIKPYLKGFYYSTYVSMGLTQAQQPAYSRDTYVLTLEHLAAFEEERFSLPEAQIKPNITFYYTTKGSDSPEDFWSRHAKETSKEAEAFMKSRDGIRQAVAELTATGDAQTKLRKLYARVAQVRNLSYESTKGSQEQARVTPKEIKNVEDVLKSGYGSRRQINRLFIAMARAAGFNAEVARISQRDAQIFHRQILDESQLDGEIAVVQVDGKQLLLDPATPFCTFGMLAWENTGVEALAISKDGGKFLETPMPEASDAVMRRTADLAMDGEGNLKGTVAVEFTGHYSHRHRLDSLETDDVEQKKAYEKLLEGWLPTGSHITLMNVTGKTDPEKPLRLEYSVEIPSLTTNVGARILAPLLIFQAKSTNPFESNTRLHPIYFRHPYDDIDKVHITLPAEMKVESVPLPIGVNNSFASYRTKWEHDEKSVSVTRQETMNGFTFAATDHPHLQAFFRRVNAGDKNNAVLRAKP